MRMRFKPYAHDELMAADFHVHEPLIWGGKWHAQYARPEQPFVLELGCGKGGFISQLACAHPENNYLGKMCIRDRRHPARHERQCRRGRPRGAGGQEVQHRRVRCHRHEDRGRHGGSTVKYKTLSVNASHCQLPRKGGAFDIPEKFSVLPRARPSGELANNVSLRGFLFYKNCSSRTRLSSSNSISRWARRLVPGAALG